MAAFVKPSEAIRAAVSPGTPLAALGSSNLFLVGTFLDTAGQPLQTGRPSALSDVQDLACAFGNAVDLTHI